MFASRWREIRGFVRGHRLLVVGVSIVMFTLAAGATQSRIGFLRARRAQRQAEHEAAVARAVSGFMTGLLALPPGDRSRGDALTVRQALDAGAARLETEQPYAADPEVASAVRLALGEAYQAIGAYDDALPLIERAVGKTHVAYTQALTGAAAARAERGDLEGAEALLREALALERTLYEGAEQGQLAYTLSHLASVVQRRGKRDEAVALYRESLELLRRTMGDDSPAVALALCDLGVALERAGRWTEAEPMLVDAWTALVERVGAENPRAVGVAEVLATHYQTSGAADLAVTWRRRAGGKP